MSYPGLFASLLFFFSFSSHPFSLCLLPLMHFISLYLFSFLFLYRLLYLFS